MRQSENYKRFLAVSVQQHRQEQYKWPTGTKRQFPLVNFDFTFIRSFLGAAVVQRMRPYYPCNVIGIFAIANLSRMHALMALSQVNL